MKEKLKKIFKNKIFIFIIGGILFSSISVIAATYFPGDDVSYDNSKSGLKSTNVQSAIDELYGACSTNTSSASANLLNKVNIVTEGDGLYKDNYEDRYIYKGANPNNYIRFNDELWRIISLEADGTLKIMKNEILKQSNFGSFSGVAWGGSNIYEDFIFNYIRTLKDMDKVVYHSFSVGPVTTFNNNLSEQIKDENSEKWSDLMGLVTVSEYLRTNSNEEDCGVLSRYDDRLVDPEHEYWNCYKTNWMDSIATQYIWTLNYNDTEEFTVGASYVYLASTTNINAGVVPVVYLSSHVKISNGEGTESNPYIIE